MCNLLWSSCYSLTNSVSFFCPCFRYHLFCQFWCKLDNTIFRPQFWYQLLELVRLRRYSIIAFVLDFDISKNTRYLILFLILKAARIGASRMILSLLSTVSILSSHGWVRRYSLSSLSFSFLSCCSKFVPSSVSSFAPLVSNVLFLFFILLVWGR